MRRAIQPVSLLPTAEPTRDDLLFFAGFYDGEGSAQGKKGSCIMQLVQKDPELLFRARSLWGGSIYVNNMGISHWVMTGDRARRFLQAIYPFLSTRRQKQLEAAGALTLTGRKCLDESGMTQERALQREGLSEVQKHSESCIRWAKSNPEKYKEITDRYRANNRVKINQRQRDKRAQEKMMKSCTSNPEIIERNTLVN